jgi:hypothetical protein
MNHALVGSCTLGCYKNGGSLESNNPDDMRSSLFGSKTIYGLRQRPDILRIFNYN